MAGGGTQQTELLLRVRGLTHGQRQAIAGQCLARWVAQAAVAATDARAWDDVYLANLPLAKALDDAEAGNGRDDVNREVTEALTEVVVQAVARQVDPCLASLGNRNWGDRRFARERKEVHRRK